MEGRASQAGELLEGTMTRTRSLEDISPRLQRIAELASLRPKRVLTTLAHHIDLHWLRVAHDRTRKGGAAGTDGTTAKQYAENLEGNLQALLDRFKSGTYRAPSLRRVHIPKGDGRTTRPIGIPTFEDKILQRALAMALEAVYEQDFLPCSYGFRPGRSAHDALDAVWSGVVRMRGGWVLEVDIQRFFDSVDHAHLRSILDQRVRDGVIRRMIDKWLRAGVLEDGVLSTPEAGTPQGGVISPLLANIFLHEILDQWFENEVRPRLGGDAVLVRYADDFVIVFERERDARRVMDVLPKRLGKYGLTLHPEKTRLVRFERPSNSGEPPGSFDLLGFRHLWARSWKGYWVVKQQTAPASFGRSLKRVAEWCRRWRHLAVKEQHASLSSKLRGHYAYFGRPGNFRALARFQLEVERTWRRWLNRRSQRARMDWKRMKRLLNDHGLPSPSIIQRGSRVAANPTA
jgi:group II intron reverse transcriptase/maturase